MLWSLIVVKSQSFLTGFFFILQYLPIKDTMTSLCATTILFQVAKTENLSEHTVLGVTQS